MTESQLLYKQTADAYEWTTRLLDGVPFEKWDIAPEGVASTLSWQVGHLIVSSYFHSIWVVTGHQMDVLQAMPMKQYGEWYTNAPPQLSVGRVDPPELLKHFHVMQKKSLDVISKRSDADLDASLESTPVPHPIAKKKGEAIDWNIKHTMYHCGQIGLLRRIIDSRYDFGLRLS